MINAIANHFLANQIITLDVLDNYYQTLFTLSNSYFVYIINI